MSRRPDFRLFALAILLFLSACYAPEADSPTQPAPNSPTPPPPTATRTPTPTPTPQPTVTPTIETIQPDRFQVCSPLQGIPIDQIDSPDLLKNPFDPPRAGYDDGHFGIDLSYWTDAQGKPMQGLPVQAVLPGRVAGIINNRQPYGYAVIVETALEPISENVRSALDLPAPRLDFLPAVGLACPAYNTTFNPGPTSIYTIYAHLNDPPEVHSGETVACGQVIGAVGTTGRSVNAHLHLEMRHGPAGIMFASMAHYDNAATREEMRQYCLWRVSGAFAPFDPLRLLRITQQER